MSGITFLSQNYFDDASLSMTTGTENAQFPLTNLQNDSPSIKFKGIGSTSVIVIDLGVTRDIDTVAIAADPQTSFLISSASFKTSTSTDFSLSPSYSIDLSMEQTIGFKQITEVSHRYVQLTLVGSGGSTELGRVFVGKAINIPLNSFSVSSFKYAYNDRSTIKENKYGQRFIDEYNSTKILAGTIEFCTKDEQEELDDMFIYHGQNKPVWLILDSNSDAFNEGKFKLTIYGYFNNEISWSAAGGQLYNISVEVRQTI